MSNTLRSVLRRRWQLMVLAWINEGGGAGKFKKPGGSNTVEEKGRFYNMRWERWPYPEGPEVLGW